MRSINKRATFPGHVRDYLPTDTWYDDAGNVVKTATGKIVTAGTGDVTGYWLLQKYAYDGRGRLVKSYTCYDTNETAYAEAADVTGDTVVEQRQTWYDRAGEPVATATYQRLPGDTTSTGELTAANSYATAAVAWYDGLGRLVATADYGREDVDSGLAHYFFDDTAGATYGKILDTNPADGIPDVAQNAPPATDSSNNYIVALTQYDAAGRTYRTIDNLGRINETQYDDAGRTIRTVQNRVNGTVEETDTQQDVTVAYEFDSGGRLATLIVTNAKGDDSNPNNQNVEQQKTKYLYTSTVNASWQTGVVYPDSADTLSQNSTTKVWTITTDTGDHTATAYDQLGRTTSTTDQRGVTHDFTFDSAGRLSLDKVTNLGTSGIVDDSILSIGRTYDDLGRVQTVTSYSDISGTTPVNRGGKRDRSDIDKIGGEKVGRKRWQGASAKAGEG